MAKNPPPADEKMGPPAYMVSFADMMTLILTFFFRYMKDLIESGYVYIATPPLYLVKKGNNSRYAWSDDERDYRDFE